MCLACGYNGSVDGFEIRDRGLGDPPGHCVVCAGSWREAVIDERPTQLRRMICPKCGFEKYYELFDDIEPHISSRRRRFGKPSWNLELSEPVDCECVLQVGKHQYRRVNVGGKYEYHCRSCGKQQYVSTHRYVTAQGIIEEWLTTGETSVLDDDIAFYLEPDLEPVSDLGFVYDCKPIERGHDSFWTSQLEASTAPLKSSHREMTARYRKIIKHQRIQEIAASRSYKIQSLVDTIAAYCSDMQVQTEDLLGSLDSIKRCLTAFDEVVLTANRINSRGDIRADRLLTNKQLEQVAAAAAYHYLPELTQEQAVGTPESIFPDLTRPTLGSWLQYVKLWDPL